jgi:hypothetical protein
VQLLEQARYDLPGLADPAEYAAELVVREVEDLELDETVIGGLCRAAGVSKPGSS